MKKYLGVIILFIIVFYTLYPQAISFFGYSFLFTVAAGGLGLYLYQGRPFPDIMNIALAYFPIVLLSWITVYMTSYSDPYLYDYTKSQIAWLFGSFLVVFLFFIIHPRGSFILFLYYIIAAILAQCIISIAMHQNEAVRNFCNSLQMSDFVNQIKRDDTEGKRLLGYGVAFFGAGVSCGFALILIVYIAIKGKFRIIQLALLAAVYCIILYVGLLSARTTSIGLFASLILAVILLITGNAPRSQLFKFVAVGAILASIGSTLCYIYFPEFSDWAFEGFINYQKSGKFSTQSSDGLENMFILPYTFDQWVYGWGHMEFWGSDVGYTRLLFWIGLPGTIAYFLYQFILMKMSFTKDQAWVFTLLIAYAYNLALNVKGLSDLNLFMYFFIFYFLHYKYYIYTPQLYRLGKINKNKLHYAVQSKAANGRI